MRLLDFLNAPWALQPDRLQEMVALYVAHTRREKLDLKAWEAATGQKAGSRPDPYTVVDGVAVLDIAGVMVKNAGWLGALCGMVGTAQLRQDLQQAVEDPAVQAIILRFDSPGGSVDGTQEFAQAIAAVRGVKPIVALADGTMASAAYWAGSAAEKVFITSDTTLVGSIGVVTTHVDLSQAEAAMGRRTTEVTAGKYKRIASSYAPLSEEGRAVIQDQVDHIYSIFVDSVASHRGVSVETVLAQMADGRVFLGKQAIDAGLVDGVSSLDALIADLSQRTATPKAGAGAALNPNSTSQEDLMKITREALEAMEGGPELLTELTQAARAEGLAEGSTAGAAAELLRVKGCLGAALPGYEAQAREFALDGHTQPGDAALAINAQHTATLEAARLRAEKGGQDPLPAGGDPDQADTEQAKKGAQNDPNGGKAFAAEIRTYIAAEAAKGRIVTTLQAAAELRKGKE